MGYLLRGTFNQEKAFSVITNLRMELFEALDGGWRGGGNIKKTASASAL